MTHDELDDLFSALRQESLTPQEKGGGRESLHSFMKEVRPEASERLNSHMTQKQSVFSGPGDHLTSEEFAQGRAELRSFIASHPVRESTLWSSVLSSLKLGSAPLLATALLVVISAGTVAYAAEGSVPGDALYSFKINVTEPVLATIYNDEEGRALWTMKRLERRLKESNELIARQESRADRWQLLDTSVEQLQQETDALIVTLEERGKKEVVATLRRHLNTTVEHDPVIRLDDDDSPRGRLIARFKSMRPRPIAQEFALPPSGDRHTNSDRKNPTSEKEDDTHDVLRVIPQLPEVEPLTSSSSKGQEEEQSSEQSEWDMRFLQTGSGSMQSESSRSREPEPSSPSSVTSSEKRRSSDHPKTSGASSVQSSDDDELPLLPEPIEELPGSLLP